MSGYKVECKCCDGTGVMPPKKRSTRYTVDVKGAGCLTNAQLRNAMVKLASNSCNETPSLVSDPPFYVNIKGKRSKKKRVSAGISSKKRLWASQSPARRSRSKSRGRSKSRSKSRKRTKVKKETKVKRERSASRGRSKTRKRARSASITYRTTVGPRGGLKTERLHVA